MVTDQARQIKTLTSRRRWPQQQFKLLLVGSTDANSYGNIGMAPENMASSTLSRSAIFRFVTGLSPNFQTRRTADAATFPNLHGRLLESETLSASWLLIFS